MNIRPSNYRRWLRHCLEAVSGGAYVRLCNVVVGCCNLDLVNNNRTQAIAVNSQVWLFTIAVAVVLDAGRVLRFGALVVSVQYSFVVSADESFHVFATAVAYAYVASVKKFRKLVIGRKVFVDEL